MSKKATSKENQEYNPKPIFAMCSNCKHFISDKIKSTRWSYIEEKNIRCSIGGFAVKKQGTCKLHERND